MMKNLPLLLAVTALAATSACTKKAGDTSTPAAAAASSAPTVAVAPPASGDWTEAVAPTAAGGFVMGNPDAKVKLVEYGSMTCPHCAAFDKEGVPTLLANYVKNGKVSWEFRNFVRDPYDLTASLIARCNGAKSVFGLTRAIYAAQPEWIAKLQIVPPATMEALSKLPPAQQFPAYAKEAGFQQFAAMRGVPVAKTDACLTDTKEIDRLVQMNSDAVSQYNVPGTPTFLINNTVVPDTATWELLEPKIKAALG
jgi:protein-disulfide isomerase